MARPGRVIASPSSSCWEGCPRVYQGDSASGQLIATGTKARQSAGKGRTPAGQPPQIGSKGQQALWPRAEHLRLITVVLAASEPDCQLVDDNGLGLYDAARVAAKPAFERDHLGFG